MQFKSATTSESTEQLLVPGTDLLETDYATNQITSDYRYLADFNLSIEPTIKIYEVPIAQKTIHITDYVPTQIDVTPYQQKANSQIIGFLIQREAVSHAPYPPSILLGEGAERTKYLESNNVHRSEKLPKFSRSHPTLVQVFRRTQKPTKYSAFKRGELIFEKSIQTAEISRLFV